MRWNESQRQAIEEREKNIIVSAAAGSGKTAVLVERIVRLIVEENTGVDELLVVTFTKAAASEMKERIGSAIKKTLIETDQPEKKEFLKEQLEILGQASISTFHSFAMDLIKNYYYVADISPDLTIADETQVVIMKLEAMDQVFAEQFESKDNYEFIKLLNHYSSHKNETGIKQSLLTVYEKIMAMVEPFKWLNENIEKTLMYDQVDGLQDQKLYNKVVDLYIKKLNIIYNLKERIVNKLNDQGLVKLSEKQRGDLKPLKELRDMLTKDRKVENFDKVRGILSKYKFTQLRATKDEKEEYELIKDEISVIRKKATDLLKEIKSGFPNDKIIDSFKDVKSNYTYMKEIERLLLAFHRKFSDMKIDKNIMDFNDIEHFALEILKNEQVQEECRERIKYIFVDEYQDSNYIQEAIINKVRRKDNLFLVGDLKQSIYGFRLAEPDIFRERYQVFQSDPESIKIDLNQNFRCKKNIIDGINYVFDECMDDYDENARLNQGVSNDACYDFPVEIIVAEEEFEDMDNEVFKELLDIKKAELEAFVVADRIINLMSSDTVIYDQKKGIERKIEYRDIVILIRSLKNTGEILQKVLSRCNIPVFLNNNGGYFESTEIALLLDFLKVIDNPYNDIPLISLMYSTVFDFDIDDLMVIRKQLKNDTFYNAVLNYLENGEDIRIINKISNMVSKLDTWRSQGKFMPLDQFVWKIINESGIYLDAGLKQSGKQRQLNLRTFVEKTKVYLEFGENSIFGLLNYFEIVKSNIETGTVSLVAKDEDTVQITTIHKSKGLEYPVVIIPAITKNFMRTVNEGIIYIDKNMGIGIKTRTKEGALVDNVFIDVVNQIKADEQRDEEIRILYVAMTRAKDMLVMVGNTKKFDDAESKLGIKDKKTYLDCVLLPAIKHRETFDIYEKNISQVIPYEESRDDIDDNKKTLADLLKKPVDDDKFNEISKLMEYKYPYTDEFNIQSKYAVTELNKKDTEENHEIVVPDFSESKEKTIDNVQYGKIYHALLEQIDFAKVLKEGKNYIKESILKLEESGFLTKQEAKLLNVTKIDKFVNSEVGKRAANAVCYKERKFTMNHKVNGYDTLVQGAIDCYFEEKDEFVIIDYKTGKNQKEVLEKYIMQIELYKEALEKSTGKKVKEGWIYFFGDDQGVRAF